MPGRLFEPGLCGAIRRRGERAGLLPGQREALDQAQHAGLAVRHGEPFLDDPAQIDDAPRGDPLAPGVRPAQNQRPQTRLLALAQPAGPPGARPVAQALHALGVEPLDPALQRLDVEPGQAGRLAPRQPVERVGYAEQPGAHPAIAFAPGEPAQVVGALAGADGDGGGHAAAPMGMTCPSQTRDRPRRFVTTS